MTHYLDNLQNTIRNHWNQKALCDYQGEAFTYGDLASAIEQFRIFFEKAVAVYCMREV